MVNTIVAQTNFSGNVSHGFRSYMHITLFEHLATVSGGEKCFSSRCVFAEPWNTEKKVYNGEMILIHRMKRNWSTVSCLKVKHVYGCCEARYLLQHGRTSVVGKYVERTSSMIPNVATWQIIGKAHYCGWSEPLFKARPNILKSSSQSTKVASNSNVYALFVFGLVATQDQSPLICYRYT